MKTKEKYLEAVEAACKAFYETPGGLTNWEKMKAVEPQLAATYRVHMARAVNAFHDTLGEDSDVLND